MSALGVGDDIGSMDVLIGHGADIEARGDWCYTPFHLLTGSTRLGIPSLPSSKSLQFLASKGADIEARDFDGRTALFLAVDEVRSGVRILRRRNDRTKALLEAIRTLLELGCDVNAVDNHGESPRTVAEKSGFILWKIFVEMGVISWNR